MNALARAIVLVTLVISLSGCNGPKAVVGLDPNTIRYPGFETFPTPRTFDGPGTVFRIDRTGKRHFVAHLPVKVSGPHAEALATSADVSSVSIHAVAQLLANPSAFQNVAGSAGANSSALQTVDLGTGNRSRTDEGEMDAAIRASTFEFKPGNRYYVVREAIAVGKIEYVFAEWVGTNASLMATLKSIATGTAGITWQDAAARRMSQTFTTPHYLFFLPDEIFPPAPGVFEGTGSTRSRAPVDLRKRRLTWTSEAPAEDPRP